MVSRVNDPKIICAFLLAVTGMVEIRNKLDFIFFRNDERKRDNTRGYRTAREGKIRWKSEQIIFIKLRSMNCF